MKQCLVLIQQIFVEADPSTLMPQLRSLLAEVSKPNSGIPTPSYISIMLKYFVANLLLRGGEMDEAAALSKEMLDNDVRAYFGHMQSELSIEPMLIILNSKFDKLTQLNPQEEGEMYAVLFKQVHELAKDTEKQIIAI